MQLAASWHPGTRFAMVSTTGLNLRAAGIEETLFTSWAAAHQALKDVRRRAFHLKKLHGQIPQFRLVLNTDLVSNQERLARCVPILPAAEAVGL